MILGREKTLPLFYCHKWLFMIKLCLVKTGEDELVTEDSKSNNTKLFMVAMVIVAFLVFFVLKINGYFDFTHRFGIKDISTTIDRENAMLMIDNDEVTTWNEATFLGETKALPKDNVTVTFDAPRQISGLGMDGEVPDELEIKGGNGQRIYAEMSDGRYTFLDPVVTDTLVIEVSGKDEVTWNISELSIWE